MKYLPDILKFIDLLHRFQRVERHIHVKGREHKENDAEHSYQLAMVAWYFIEKFNLSLDANKVIKYALVHDLVEVYAGDTWAYEADQDYVASKSERERLALGSLTKEFPEFSELPTLLENYEKRADPESRFVYALDKVLPVINIYLDEGRTWHKQDISLEMLLAIKYGKVDLHEEVKICFDELVSILRTEEKKLFPK